MKTFPLAAVLVALSVAGAAAVQPAFVLNGTYYHDPVYEVASENQVRVTGRVALGQQASVVVHYTRVPREVQDRLMGEFAMRTAMRTGEMPRSLSLADIRRGVLDMDAALVWTKRAAKSGGDCVRAGFGTRGKEYEVTVRNRSNLPFFGYVELDMDGDAEPVWQRVWAAPGVTVRVPMRISGHSFGVSVAGVDVYSYSDEPGLHGTITLFVREGGVSVPVAKLRVPR